MAISSSGLSLNTLMISWTVSNPSVFSVALSVSKFICNTDLPEFNKSFSISVEVTFCMVCSKAFSCTTCMEVLFPVAFSIAI
ncbi:Uncharacterised protein [Mycobacterium tuberculosis]|nr:Uncharacterised protein [Mycobacterium tuberculosis]